MSPHLIYIGSISPASFALHIQLRAIPLPAPSVAPQKPCSQLHCNFAAPPIAGSKSTGVSLLSFEDSRSSPLPLACSNCPLMQLIAPQREVHHIAGGEPRVVASRRDRRAPPMGGIRRERRGGGHRRGWRDDWSCRGRAGRRLGGGVRASRRCCCSFHFQTHSKTTKITVILAH